MGDTVKRAAFGRNAVASVYRYQPDEIFRLWENVLRECIAGQTARLTR